LLDKDRIRNGAGEQTTEIRSSPHRGLFGRTSARMMESGFVAGAMIAAALGLKPQGREGNRPA
jgi:hypothetical protein